MQRICVVAACAAATFGALAPSASAGDGGKDCQLNRAPGVTFDNPGQMWRYIRGDSLPDRNPHDVVENYPNDFRNVGDVIAQKCRS